jgi:predicted esterase
MPGWFDIFDWPIGVGCQNDEDGLKRSVETIHDCVRDLEAKGVDKSRIVIGGFSQGGAVALRAVYSSANANGNGNYAACVNLSGWLTFEETNEVNDHVPLFWGHGSFDDKVLFEQQAYGVHKLTEVGVKNVKDSSYSVGHSSHPQEMVDFAKFLNEVLFGVAGTCEEKK